jgi:hypothetical protein
LKARLSKTTMKRMLLVLLAACAPLCADEKASDALAPVVSKETKAATPSNFCGQAEMQRLFSKTEIGKQLQLRQQEALRQAKRQAMHEAMAKGEISVQEYMQYEYEQASASDKAEVMQK